MTKSSKDILTELFSTFDPTFKIIESELFTGKYDEDEAHTSKTRKHKVKKKKKPSDSDDESDKVKAKKLKNTKLKKLKVKTTTTTEHKISEFNANTRKPKKKKSKNKEKEIEDGEIRDEEMEEEEKPRAFKKYVFDEDERKLIGLASDDEGEYESFRSKRFKKNFSKRKSKGERSCHESFRRMRERWVPEHDDRDRNLKQLSPDRSTVSGAGKYRFEKCSSHSTTSHFKAFDADDRSSERHSQELDEYGFPEIRRTVNSANPTRMRSSDRYHQRSSPSLPHVRLFKSYHENWQREKERHHLVESYCETKYRRNEVDYNSKGQYDSRTGFGYNEDRERYDHHDRHSRTRKGRDSHRSEKSRRSRSRSRSRSYSPRRDDVINKAKLLEIARKNTSKLVKSGNLAVDIFSKEQMMAIKSGGKSIEELTAYCQKLAKKDASGDAFSSDDENEETFLNHPFQVKEKPLPQITMNIRNAVPLPVRTPQELALDIASRKTEFPVSSGTQHRIKELEWKPVEDKDKEKSQKEENSSTVPVKNNYKIDEAVQIKPEQSPQKKEESGITYETPVLHSIDIAEVISMRLKAMRELQENPEDENAKAKLKDAQHTMKTYANAKALEPKFLSQTELASGTQAWATKDQLKNAKAVEGGMGMYLLQKMGWAPGEGLGKFKKGTTVPLALDIKMDKKGLTSAEDLKNGPAMPLVYDLSGKHPVSALMELTVKRRWGAPAFELCFEHGPSHKKQFVYKVTVNGMEYQPCVASSNKKEAKANCAAFCLQSLGLLPTDPATRATENLKTVPDNPLTTNHSTPGPSELQLSSSTSTSFTTQTPKQTFLQTVPPTALDGIHTNFDQFIMPPPPFPRT